VERWVGLEREEVEAEEEEGSDGPGVRGDSMERGMRGRGAVGTREAK